MRNLIYAIAQLHRFCPWCVEFGSLLASFFVCWLVFETYLFKNLDPSESDVRMVGIYVHIHIHIHTYIHIYIYRYKYRYRYIYMHTYTYIYIYIHIRISIHIYTYTDFRVLSFSTPQETSIIRIYTCTYMYIYSFWCVGNPLIIKNSILETHMYLYVCVCKSIDEYV